MTGSASVPGLDRWRLLKRYLRSGRGRVPLREMAGRLLQPSAAKRAAEWISGIEARDGWLEVRYRGLDAPLFWPRELGTELLFQATVEIMDPRDWHRYEWGPSPIREDDVVVDCGAAEGLFSLSAVRRCRWVHAVEPLPRFRQALALTLAPFPNARIHPFALSDADGTAALVEDGFRSSLAEPAPASAGQASVSVRTIDGLFYEADIPVSYIKADLEGGELKMMRGARRTIAACLPRIAITTYHAPEHAARIADFLHSIDPRYRIAVKGLERTWGAPVMLHAGIE
jgi:FkbM family methyltransferase